MEETKNDYIPVGQAEKIKNKTIRFNKFIKINKIKIIIGVIAMSLIGTYIILIKSFINYMTILGTFM